MGIRALVFGCREDELTCATCRYFQPKDGYVICPWIRDIQIARGVRKVDDHVGASHDACAGYTPRLEIVEDETWLVATNLVAG